MAWTAPRTWVATETLTAALLNTHLRDNMLETAPAKAANAGEWFRATAANAIEAFDSPKAKAILSSSQTISDSTATAVSWNSEDYDVGGLWAGGNPTRFTLPDAGKYIYQATVQWAANATGARKIEIRENGTTFLQTNEEPAEASNVRSQQVIGTNDFAATDYVELIVTQFSTGNLDLTAGGTLSNMTVSFLGA